VGTGILVKGEARCADCFRCSLCHFIIRNLVYGTRGDMIFCMDCDEVLCTEERARLKGWTPKEREDAFKAKETKALLKLRAVPSSFSLH
jgi:hypothetical protein